MDGEEDFPRGGQATLSALERREIAQKAKHDVLFRDTTTKEGDDQAAKLEAGIEEAKPEKRKKRKREAQEAADKDASPEKRKFSADVLTFKKLSVGMLILGAVNEVNDFELVVSLPHGITGYVRPTDVSPPYTEALIRAAEAAEAEVARGDEGLSDSDSDEAGKSDADEAPLLSSLFHVGELLTCVIKETHSAKDSKRRRIRLSVHASEVNKGLSGEALRSGTTMQGFVSSVEDHGYIISFGFKKRTGFLLARRAKTYIKQFNNDRPLVVGQPVRCLVLECDSDTRVVPVTINPIEVADAVANSDSVMRFSELTPGLLISGKVLQRAANGLAVTFLDGIAGMISTHHLPNNLFTAGTFPPNKKIKARIIHIRHDTKVIGLAAQRHMVENTGCSFPDLSVGNIIEEATVKHVDGNVGVTVTLNEEEEVFGFVHISHLSDDHVEKIGKKHKAGTTHRCRVLGFNSLDGLASVSFQKSVLERPFLSYKDVILGAPVKVEVLSVETFGVAVAISEHLHGLIPLMHLADIPLKKPGKKFREGAHINCRILEVTPSRRRLLLTAKKSMVRSEFQGLSKVNEALVGATYTGFVASIRHYGLIVAFYGGITGLLHRTELSVATFEDDLNKLYYVGQVMNCRVISTAHNKLRLSLKSHDSVQTDMQGTAPGQVYSATYASNGNKGVEVRLQPGNKAISVPNAHLSDFPQHCDQLARCLATKDEAVTSAVLNQVVILGCRPLLVSCKPSLRPADGETLPLPQLSTLQVGQVLMGHVRQVVSYGVFVELTSQLVGLVPARCLADEFVPNPVDVFKAGQTVVVKVTEIDSSRERFLLSMKLSELGLSSGPALPVLLDRFWQERSTIDACLAKSSAKRQAVHSVQIGTLVECEYVRCQSYGVSLKVCCSGATAIAPLSHAPQREELIAGDIVTAAVLDRDTENAMLFVSLSDDIISVWRQIEDQSAMDTSTPKKKKKERKSGDKEVPEAAAAAVTAASASALKSSSVGDFTEGIVQLVKDDSIVLSLPACGSALALGLAHQHINDYRQASKRYSVGQKLKAEIVRLPTGDSPYALVSLGRLPKTQKKSAEDPSKRSGFVSPGDVVTVRVKSVQGLQLNVSLTDKLNGRIFVSDFMDKPMPGAWPFQHVQNGDEIKCRVLGFRKVKSNRHLDVSHQSFYQVAELSAKESVVADESLTKDALEGKDYSDEIAQSLAPGKQVVGFVREIWKDGLQLYLSPSVRAKLPLLEVVSTPEEAANPEKLFKNGRAVAATVLAKPEKSDQAWRLTKSAEIAIGEVRTCRIAKVLPDEALLVQLPGMKAFARCSLTDISDAYEEDPLSNYPCHMMARCYILEKKSNGQYDVSLRPSRTLGSASSNADAEMPDTSSDADRHKQPGSADIRDREIESIADIKSGEVVRGYVKAAVDNAGLFVRLSRNLVGRAKITNLSENFIKNWKKAYPIGKLVVTKIMQVDYTQNKVELSLRESHITPQKRKRDTAGAKDTNGASTKRTKLTGGRVLEAASGDVDDDDTGNDSDAAEMQQIMEEMGGEMLTSGSESEMDDDDDSDDDDEEEEEDEGSADKAKGADQDSDSDDSDTGNIKLSKKSSKSVLKLPGKFDWSSAGQADSSKRSAASDSSSDEEADGEEGMSQSQRKKTRRQKKAEKKQEEANLRAMEEALLDKKQPMETTQDFERKLMVNPDDPQTWIRFMALYLRSAEIEKARAVAKRALDAINFRDEKGKLDVWVAWLNIENSYGTQDSIVKITEEAVRSNDPKKILLNLVRIYLRSRKFDLAEELYASMVKRFSSDKEVWEQYILFKFQQKRPEGARDLLNRSLKILPKFEHVEMISKVAQLEMKYGEAERGQTTFEILVSNYPKRVDLWFIYIDLLLRNGNVQAARGIFERVVNVQLSAKKMKSVLKRYQEFKEQHGDGD